jgi:hypothetical protein
VASRLVVDRLIANTPLRHVLWFAQSEILRRFSHHHTLSLTVQKSGKNLQKCGILPSKKNILKIVSKK